MKIIVSGSKGAIGSNLVPHLWDKGHSVYETTTDITDFVNLEKEVAPYLETADTWINLAALVNTITCDAAGRHSFDANVKGEYNVAVLSKNAAIHHCYFSTTAIYKPNVPIFEDQTKDPQTLYGFTKYLGELTAEFVFKDRRQDLLIVRPCFAFGGDSDHSIGSKLIESAYLSNGQPLVVQLDPENMKDYMAIENLSDAIEKLIAKRSSGDYNISFGKPIKFGEMVKIAEKIVGRKPNVYYMPERDYMKNHVVDNTKVFIATGWKPTVTVEQQMRKILEKIIKKYE